MAPEDTEALKERVATLERDTATLQRKLVVCTWSAIRGTMGTGWRWPWQRAED